MNEENPTFITHPEAESQGGQTMYIHLPEGAVIVDRSNATVQSASATAPLISEPIPAQAAPAQPYPNLGQSTQPEVQFVQSQPAFAYVNPQPGVAYVQGQPGVAYAQPQPGVTYVQGQPGMAYAQPQPQLGDAFLQGESRRAYRRRQNRDQIVLSRRHRTDWVHSMTVAFATYVILVTLVPVILSGIFGIGFYASKSENAELTIGRGELIISHLTPVARVIPGDLVLLRDSNTWNLQIRQVGSTNTIGLVTTISTNTGLNATSSEVLTMDSNAPVRNITSAIPVFGYFVTFFSSAFGKVLGAAFIFYLNLRHLVRKRRARHTDEKFAYVVDRSTLNNTTFNQTII